MPPVFTSDRSGLAIELAEHAWDELAIRVRGDSLRETGGILIGSYNAAGTTVYVTRTTSQPADSQAGTTWFKRGIRGLARLLRLASADGQHYVGEWHYHPRGSPEPSPTDVLQMRKLAAEPGGARAPVLIIIGGHPEDGLSVSASIVVGTDFLRLDPRSVPHSSASSKEDG